MLGQALTGEEQVAQHREAVATERVGDSSTADRVSEHSGSDGPEFSSAPMPAAYGALVSAGIGLVIIAACVAFFWL